MVLPEIDVEKYSKSVVNKCGNTRKGGKFKYLLDITNLLKIQKWSKIGIELGQN